MKGCAKDSKWRAWLFVACLPLAAPSPAAADPEEALHRQIFFEPHMGTLMRITLFAPDEETGAAAARAGFIRIQDLDAILSDYDPASELRQLTSQPAGSAVKVSDDLFEVLRRSQELSALSEGAFDITIGPLVHLWREARRAGTLPDGGAIREAKRRTGYKNLRLDHDGRTVTLLIPGMQLDLGGIAKGYAADEALKVLRDHGISRAMVAAAGDIAMGDPPPNSSGWRIGVASINFAGLTATISLSNRAISTSGDTEQFVDIDGVRYSHIVDPESGRGLTERIAVTVLAAGATTADSLSTLVSVLGLEGGMRLIESLSGVEALILRMNEGGMEQVASSGFPTE